LKNELAIGTRGSRLALWQSEHVLSLLNKLTEKKIGLKKIKTTGDKILDSPLAKIGDKGLFVKEIEQEMLSGQIDLAVHSMKDVPTVLPEGLIIGAVLVREDPRDVLITSIANDILSLPEGAKVGTSSLRRRAQLLYLRPDLEIVDVRGNLDTRLRKLEEKEFEAIILAGAGVRRLGYQDKITFVIPEEQILPAVGQGAIAIEIRENDLEVNELVKQINHEETSLCVQAERALMKELEGGCQVPIGAWAKVENNRIHLNALISDINGIRILKASESAGLNEAHLLGINVARKLIEQGAKDILNEIR
jgi:hydroxymethylbilane synthase